MAGTEVQILSWAEAVRKRPAMYFGDLGDGTGLCSAVRWVLGGAMDEFIAGRATTVLVDVTADGSIEIADDGPGIFATPRSGESATLEHAVSTFGKQLLPRAIGSWNYGSCYGPVSAVSSFFEIESTYGGKRVRLRCERGEIVERTHLGLSSEQGTRVRFRPDEAIFEGRVTPALVADLITETSWLHPRLCLVWQGERLANGGGIEAWTRLRASSELADDFVFATRMQHGDRKSVV